MPRGVLQWRCAQRAATGEESSDSLDASAKDPAARTSGVPRAPFDVDALRLERVKGTYLQDRYFYVDSLEHALHIVRCAATQLPLDVQYSHLLTALTNASTSHLMSSSRAVNSRSRSPQSARTTCTWSRASSCGPSRSSTTPSEPRRAALRAASNVRSGRFFDAQRQLNALVTAVTQTCDCRGTGQNSHSYGTHLFPHSFFYHLAQFITCNWSIILYQREL